MIYAPETMLPSYLTKQTWRVESLRNRNEGLNRQYSGYMHGKNRRIDTTVEVDK